MTNVRRLRRAIVVTGLAAATALTIAPTANAQGAGREVSIEIGRASTIPDKAVANEPFELDLQGIMFSTHTFKEVRLRRLDLVTIPPLQVVEVDAYAVDGGGFGITTGWKAKKEITLPAGNWVLRFNQRFGRTAVFEAKIIVEGPAPTPENLAFQDIDRGSYGGINEARSVVVTDQASWERLWRA